MSLAYTTNKILSYCNKKQVIIFLLGVASGLPFALMGGTLQVWFAQQGFSLRELGFMGLIMQPYALKFLWASYLDSYKFPWLTSRRGWILTCQIILAVLISMMGTITPSTILYGIRLMLPIAFLAAVVSATLDMAIDAYRIELLSNKERALGSAFAIEGYRIGNIVSSAGAFIVAKIMGWNFTYMLMSGLMALSCIITMLADEEDNNDVDVDIPKVHIKFFIDFILSFLRRSQALGLLLLVVVYKLPDAYCHVFTTPFLLQLGFGLDEVALIVKALGLFATVLGAFWGGLIMVRITLYKALLIFCFASGVTNIVYCFLAMYGKIFWLASIGIFCEQLCCGMGTAALVAYLMSLCDKRFAASQYACLTSLSVLARTYIQPIAGHVSSSFGWVNFYISAIVLIFPVLGLIIYLRKTILSYEKEQINDASTTVLEGYKKLSTTGRVVSTRG